MRKYHILLISAFLVSSCTIRPLATHEKEVGCQIKITKMNYGEINNNQTAYLQRFFTQEWERNQSCSYSNQPYTMELDFTTQIRPAFIQGDTTVARSDMILTIRYTVRDESGQPIIDHQKLMLIDSYDNTESHYSNFIVERGISNNLVRNAAKELRLAVITSMLHPDYAEPSADSGNYAEQLGARQ
ncbi:MAG: hypothetical protein JSS50_00600 [Proteobacteria bacterium]|nr:hypothetical protein [Pseudomonadota bacterium]